MLVDTIRIVYVNFHRPICHRVFLYVTWHIRSIIPLRLSLGYLSFLMMGLGEEGHIDFHKRVDICYIYKLYQYIFCTLYGSFASTCTTHSYGLNLAIQGAFTVPAANYSTADGLFAVIFCQLEHNSPIKIRNKIEKQTKNSPDVFSK